jgi:glycerol-3-phosphate dehydrogenase subunit C
MLEGDRKVTLAFAERTVMDLAEVVADGYDIVCSCPTCGYMLKNALRECAYYSEAYQDLVGGDGRHMKIPDATPNSEGRNSACGGPSELKATFGGHHMARETIQIKYAADGFVQTKSFRVLDKSIYGRILKDDGYFSSIDPLKRIQVAENTYDLGQYLLNLHRSGELLTQLGPLNGQTAYYPPCHQREQDIGMPYLDLLALIPDMSVEAVQANAYCCGIAGIMGFKRDFHKASLHLGSRLMAKIRRMDPDLLATECLSCRLQFNQMTAYPVNHPIEILRQSYENY